jgi:ribosomal protein S12 methylthiotransferase accessory factor
LNLDAAQVLRESTIAVVGLQGAGSVAARSLTAMGVGRVLSIDTIASPIDSDDDLAAALEDATFAIATDLSYRLNRVAMRTGLRWTTGYTSANEAVLGPTIYPRETACYVCYRMRTVACADDPATGFAALQSPERQDHHYAAASLLGEMLALEAANVLTRLECSAKGAIVVFDTLTMTSARHDVLPVPSCPICGGAVTPSRKTRPLVSLISSRTGIIRELRDRPPPASAPLPPHLAQSILSNFDFRKASPLERSAAGKAWTREEAHRGAIGEALERYCSSTYAPAELQFGPPPSDAPYLEPSAFMLYTDRQYAAPGFPFRRYETGAALHWRRAIRLDGTPIFVPASETYLSFPSYALGENFSLLTSTGLSAGETLDAAILGGLYECIERDAFVLNWMNRLTPAEVALDGFPLCEYARGVFAHSGIDLRVFLLASDIAVPVAMAVTVDRSGRVPAGAVGLGCHLSGSRAVERAVFEVCQVYASESGRPRQALTYQEVRTLEDHGGFFSIPERLNEFDHLFASASCTGASALPETAPDDVSVDLARVSQAVEAVGATVAFVDLTTADLRDFPVRVVRTFAAGLQPIHFGFGWERLGGTRLYSIAQRVGQDTRIRTEADLNFCPHPLP